MRSQITIYLRSGYDPGIYLVSREEARVEAEMKTINVGTALRTSSEGDRQVGIIPRTILRLSVLRLHRWDTRNQSAGEVLL